MRSGVETKYKHVNFISFLTCKQCSIIINFSFRCQLNAYRYTCKMLSWSTFEISFLYVYKITNCDEGVQGCILLKYHAQSLVSGSTIKDVT